MLQNILVSMHMPDGTTAQVICLTRCSPLLPCPPITVSPTSFAPFDVLNFPNQYSPGISIVDDDIMGNSFISGDRGMFHHTDNQLPLATDCADEGFDLIEMRDNIHSLIPRPPLQSLADKILRALNLFKEWSEGGILAQLWVPMQNGDRYILSTCEQPYLLDQTLSGYREVSRSFTFAAETKPDCFLGLPGRVNLLEAVNLRSVLPPRLYPQSFSQNQKAVLAEIADVMRAICFAHRLPLALTWIPCSYIDDAGDVTLNLHARG